MAPAGAVGLSPVSVDHGHHGGCAPVSTLRFARGNVMRQPVVPPGMVPVWMDGGGLLVLLVAVYIAGLKLGKQDGWIPEQRG